MDIRNRRDLRQRAADAVAANPGDPRLTLLVYVAATAFAGLLVAAMTTILDQRIANTGGLQNLGTQAILSTIRSTIPLVLVLAMMGLGLGRRGVALGLARRQAVEPRSLLMGFPRFGALLRTMILFGLLGYVLIMASVIVGSIIFMATPLSRDLLTIMVNAGLSGEEMYTALYNDPAFLEQMFNAMLPAYPIVGAVLLLLAAPFFYRFRMTSFCLLDGHRKGALKSIGESIRMTKGNCLSLLKLDLGFWWFYLCHWLCIAVAYGDALLPLIGVTLPWNDTASYFIFYAASLALEGLLYYFTLNKVQTTYALAYESIRPRPQPTQGGVVLGNIFDLAREQMGR